MKLTVSVTTSLIAVFSLFGSTIASTSPRLLQKCGSGGKLLNSTTVEHKGKVIQIGQMTCPDVEKKVEAKRAATGLTKRQINVCSDGSCTVECAATGNQPFVFDCQTVADYLEGLYPEEFLVAPGTYSYVSAYTCAFAFLNEDVVDYNVCTSNFGYNGIIAADDCFGDYPATTATPGAFCVTPGTSGDAWDIEVYNPE